MSLKELVEECNKQGLVVSCIIMKPNMAKEIFLDPSNGYFQELTSCTNLDVIKKGIFGYWKEIEIRVDKNLAQDIIPIYAYKVEEEE